MPLLRENCAAKLYCMTVNIQDPSQIQILIIISRIICTHFLQHGFLKIFKICPNIATTLAPLHIIINYILSHIQSTVINSVLKMGRLRLIAARGAIQCITISKWCNLYSGPTMSWVCKAKRGWYLFMIDYEAHATFGLSRDIHFNFIFPLT